jgi:uncharacterized protein Yka (UPF0111/DUF47 family)
MKWFHKIMPREEKFFVLFDRHATCIKAGAGILRRILDGGHEVPAHCNALMTTEHEADVIAHEVLEAIRRSFITPFDRSDIKGLITSMDDAIDQMNKTAKAIMLYEVTQFEDTMRQMGDVIVRSADLTAEIVPLLKNMAPNAARLHALTRQVVVFEEESDHLCDAGLKALYLEKGKQDAMAFIIGSEIYDHLEKVADGILIEHM